MTKYFASNALIHHRLPVQMKYTNANVTGSNVGGIISALAMLITLAVTDNELYKAIIYFAIAIGIVVAEIFVSNAYFRNVSGA